jgi:sugar/nucleoside kinase (ribokinase family)
MKQFDVALVGEFNLDLILYGLPESLPPERELLASNMALLLGGSPAITAHDALATQCTQSLEAAGVDLSRTVPAPPGIGTGVTVLLQHTSFRRALTYSGGTASLTFADLDLDYLRRARHFHLASFFLQQGLTQDFPRLLALLKEAGLTTSMDTNDDPSGQWAGGNAPIAEALRYIDIFMPNEKEAQLLTGTDSVESAIATLAAQVPMLVIKRGARGALVVHRGHRLEQPSIPVQPVDAVGAGDSFNAGFLHGILQGWSPEQCLRMGNLAGAYSTTQIGGVTAFQDRPAMQAFFQAHGPELPAFWAGQTTGSKPVEIAPSKNRL